MLGAGRFRDAEESMVAIIDFKAEFGRLKMLVW
jgi:hypothetical protein